MSRKYISKATKLFVANRAKYQCEYCKLRELDSFLAFEIDHLISIKHGGDNKEKNLAFTCQQCN